MDQQQVRLLVTFSLEVDLDQLASQLTTNYLFIQHIKKYPDQQLLITFDSMLDLLEIDFARQFGAISAKVRNSSSFCKEMNEEHLNSTEDGESSPSCSNNNDRFQTENLPNPSRLKGKVDRLTSLEDEVNEEEDLIKKLALFEDCDPVSRIEENTVIEEEKEEAFEHFEPAKQKENDSIWGPLVNGVVLTSLLVGGIKAITFFFR